MTAAMSIEDKVKLALVPALLGEVPACLRSVSFQVEGDLIRLRFLFDGPISDDDHEAAQIVGTEVVAFFPAPMSIDEEILRLDHPQPLNDHALAHRFYQRKEETA